MLLCAGGAEIYINKAVSLTSGHGSYICQDVGNCHNSFWVVLCQSLTSALTSARGPLWTGVLSSRSLCAVTATPVCVTVTSLSCLEWGFSVSRAALTRRAESHQLQRQVCCDPASRTEVRLTTSPAISRFICQQCVRCLWAQTDEQQWSVFEKRTDVYYLKKKNF